DLSELTQGQFTLEFFMNTVTLTVPFISVGKKPKPQKPGKAVTLAPMYVTEPGWTLHFANLGHGLYWFVVALTWLPPAGARVNVDYKAPKTPLKRYGSDVFFIDP